MLPQWLLITFSGIIATAVLLLVGLYLRRLGRRRADTVTDAGPREAPAYARTERPMSASAACLRSEVSWENRSLFAGFAQRSGYESMALPRVDVATLPMASTKDCLFGPITPVLASLLPESPARQETIKQELMTAGFHQPHAWHNLAAFRYVAVMFSIILFGTLMILMPRGGEPIVAGLLFTMAVLGWALPRLYVKSRAAARAGDIERAMPDMLDLLNMCVSQGLTVQSSLKRISRELKPVYPHLAQELAIVCEQADVGTLRQALENFSERIDVPEVHSFTTLVIQTEQMGTSISAALTEYSDNMREGLRQRADERGNQATFKLLFPTVLCLMPAVYLFLLGPAIIELSNFFVEGGRAVIDQGRAAVQQANREDADVVTAA